MTRYLNLGILAHVDAGKTTLTEQLLHSAGVVDRPGSVDHGTTQTDSLALEQQRGITIKSAVVSFELNGTTINLIDTPGHPDFIAEVERVLAVLDGAVLVVSAVEGVQAQTRILMRALKRLKIPTLIFVNKIDRVGARPNEVISEITSKLVIPVVTMGTCSETGTRDCSYEPHSFQHSKFRSSLTEALAENNEQLLPQFIEGEELSDEVLKEHLQMQVRSSLIHPVFAGTAMFGVGIDPVILGITELLPAIKAGSGSPHEEIPYSALVFKIEREPNGEKVALTRVFEGTVENRSLVEVEGVKDQKITGMEIFENGSSRRCQTLEPGTIGKLWGLPEVKIGDILGQPPAGYRHTSLAKPMFETAAKAKSSEERGVLRKALNQLAEQDPLINLRQSDLLQEIYLSLNGEVQKEVIQQTLLDEYEVEVDFSEASVICVEKPTSTGSAVELLGKSPNPFTATVGIQIEPGAVDSGVVVEFEIDPRSIPLYIYGSADEFMRSMTATIEETLEQGLNGWEIVDCVAKVTHCDYASPSSAHADYKNLTPLVVMKALKDAGTTVCEPVNKFLLDGPPDTISAALSALGRVEATITTSSTDDSIFTVEGELLASKSQELQINLMSITRGEGTFDQSFSRYQPVRGKRPSRPRTDSNPLNFEEYMSKLSRRF